MTMVKSVPNNNYNKCKWTKFSNQKDRIAKRIKKQDLSVCCLQEMHLRYKDTHTMKIKRWKKMFHANGNQRKPGVAILISDKTDLKQRL